MNEETIEIELSELLDLVKMAGLTSEVGRHIPGDGIDVIVSGFQNAGDIFVLTGHRV